jgi:hypothetical protein
MTVPNLNITSGPYIGNGAVDTYDYDFGITSKSEIRVFETTDEGVETELTVDIDYTVNSIGLDIGGTITRTAGVLPSGYQWYMRSDIESTQNTNFESQGGFFPEVHEDAFDKSTRLIQQLEDTIQRSLRISESYPLTDGDEDLMLLPSPVADHMFVFNDDATALEMTPDRSGDVDTLQSEMDAVESTLETLQLPVFQQTADVSVAFYLNLRALDVSEYTENVTCGVTHRETVGDGGGGLFYWDTDDLSSEVSADTESGIYVTPNSDATGASGAWVRIIGENVNLRWFGATGDGVTDDSTAIQAAITYSVSNDKSLFCPSGTYILGLETVTIYLNKGIDADNKGLHMFGEGRGKTIFKEQDGKTATIGRYCTMFYCWLDDPVSRAFQHGSFTFEDFTLDKNGFSNGLAPSAYEWEGAHIIKFQGNAGTESINGVTFNRLELRDKVGAGLVLGPSDVIARSIVISDVQSRDFAGLDAGYYGQKGCIEIAIDSENSVIENVNVQYSQIEPTFAYEVGRTSLFKITNSKIDTLEYTYTGTGVADGNSGIYVDISGVTCKDKYLTRGLHVNVTNSVLKNDAEFYNISSTITNSTLLLDDNGDGTFKPWYTNSPTNWNIGPNERISNCVFIIDGEDVSYNSRIFASNPRDTFTQSAKITVDNCDFDERAKGVFSSYVEGGHFKISNCEMIGYDTALYGGSLSTGKYGGMIVKDCGFSKVTGKTLTVRAYTTNAILAITGKIPLSDWDATYIVSTALADIYTERPDFTGDATPTVGSFAVGDTVYNTAPIDGGNIGWVCTVAGAQGAWRTFGVIGYPLSRTTSQLESVADTINTLNKYIGKIVINSTTGAMVYASGVNVNSVWKNMDGTTAHTPV